MKKLLCGILAFMLVFSLAACGNKDTGKDADNTDPTTENTDVTDPGGENTDDPGKTDDPQQGAKTDDPGKTDTPTNPDTPTKPDTPSQNPSSGDGSHSESWTGGDYDIEAAMNEGVIFSKLTGAEKEAFLKACKDNGMTVTFSNGDTIMTEGTGYKLVQSADGTMTVTDSDGFSAIIGYKWGNGPLAKLLTEPKFGKVDMYTETEDAMIVQYSNVTVKDFTSYCSTCKNGGFNNVQYEESNETEAVFVATNAAGYTLAMSLEDGTLMISIGTPE